MLVFNEVFNLLPVVSLERFVFELLEVPLVVLHKAQILLIRRLEQTFGGTPLDRMSHLEEAHALLLDTFNAESPQRLLVLEGLTMGVVDLGKSKLDIEVVGTRLD